MHEFKKMNAKDHYDHHLGNFYSWMVGDFDEKVAEQLKLLRERDIIPKSSEIAFDLGAGHGLQSVALAKLGYNVKAVDFNKQLLQELALRIDNLTIEVVEDEILNFLRATPEKAELIVCMGDTLTHLQNLKDVTELVANISAHLEPGGKIVFSFRDLTMEVTNEQRFIPVKSDESRIHTCFLEYFSDHVMVYDLLHEKQNGKWIQKISAYPKLRLNENFIVKLFRQNNIQCVRSEVINRVVYLIGQQT